MGLWQWIREVIADVGEHEAVPIFLERRPEEGYALRLGYRAGFGGQDTARIPVNVRRNQHPHPVLKEIHSCEVAGRTLEAANVYALREKVGRLLETIAPARTLPLCYFRVPAMDYSLPVYERGDEITCEELGGPNLKGRDLAEVRRAVCRYLVSAGYAGSPEDVEVGVLRPSDLSLVPPAAIFRSLTDPDLWIPAIEGHSAEGPVVGVLVRSGELRPPERRRAGLVSDAAPPAAEDVVGLLRYLQTETDRSRRSIDGAALYAAEVRHAVWADAEGRTTDAGTRLSAYLSDEVSTRLELPVRRTGAGDLVTALEDQGITVFLAPDEAALAVRVGRYLVDQGFLDSAARIDVHAVEPPRAERLEADEIWTHGDTVLATGSPERGSRHQQQEETH
jgi:hypothetical protein